MDGVDVRVVVGLVDGVDVRVVVGVVDGVDVRVVVGVVDGEKVEQGGSGSELSISGIILEKEHN